jgi:hypothetical protein
MPLWHVFMPVQVSSQVPQLVESVCRFTQTPPQRNSPGLHWHW